MCTAWHFRIVFWTLIESFRKPNWQYGTNQPLSITFIRKHLESYPIYGGTDASALALMTFLTPLCFDADTLLEPQPMFAMDGAHGRTATPDIQIHLHCGHCEHCEYFEHIKRQYVCIPIHRIFCHLILIVSFIGMVKIRRRARFLAALVSRPFEFSDGRQDAPHDNHGYV